MGNNVTKICGADFNQQVEDVNQYYYTHMGYWHLSPKNGTYLYIHYNMHYASFT